MVKKVILLLSLFFIFLSFSPTLYEIYYRKNLPQDRAFELVHNYVFDYNFYLSRIREGQPARNAELREAGGEGRWLVTEKYYNRPHPSSLFQIVYLLMGKLEGLGRLVGLDGLEPPVIYHGARFILGFVLLVLLGKLVGNFFDGIWQIVAYVFVITAGSWPILVKVGEGFRFSTHWGGWSVIDPLQRITFIPHVLLGQIFLVVFVTAFSGKSLKLTKLFKWWNLGLLAGIIFPPVLVTIYVILAVQTTIEVLANKSLKLPKLLRERAIFIVFSLPALLYLQVMFKVEPWKALAAFDIQHRSILPYTEYALALGPMLPLGLSGLILTLIRKEKKFFPFVSWVLSLGLLFLVFERVPQQSPTRFTQMIINVPLGILATYLFQYIFSRLTKNKRPHEFGQLGRVGKWGVIGVISGIILMGLGVMGSMVGWKTDEVRGKAAGTWLYPVGVQLVYPLKDFMDGINYLRLNTNTRDVVLAYEAAGNYIPAYAGNFVYLGHANTPDEDGKLKIATKFFKGEMTAVEVKEFLLKENIKYVYFGPQEKDIGNTKNLLLTYPFFESIYNNGKVIIYRFVIANPIRDR